MISIVGCSAHNENSDNIYEKIHELYYDMKSYKLKSNVTTYTKAGSSTYECIIDYDSTFDSYKMVSEDVKIFLSDEKCIITKGENSIESPTSENDMYIFINTFFKSYYECEDTSLSVTSNDSSDLILLECSAINPSRYINSMKLWLNRKTLKPHAMEILDADGAINTGIEYVNFDFIN